MRTEVFVSAFNAVARPRWNTILVGGYAEPFYSPGTTAEPAQIQFRADSLRSAFHEVAHWCLAGEERKRLPDYGYWYCPDGRTAAEQELFFKMEVKPQAIEMALCQQAGVSFQVSCDNLHNADAMTNLALTESQFSDQVALQLQKYQTMSFPPLAAIVLRITQSLIV